MALVKVTDLEKNQVEIEFTIDKETFDKACVASYKKNIGKLNVPGFRRGKAPKGMVEKIYGKGVFYEDALEATVPDAFDAAVKEADLKLVGRPEYDVERIDDEGVVLKAKCYTYPTVEIKDYKGVEVVREEKEVTDADVDAEIETTRRRNARQIEITDRAAAIDDIAVIDYDGYVDGKAFAGGKGENYNLKLGSGQFITGFEDQIVGHVPGDEFDVNVTFPKEYHAEELKGRPAVFKTKLHAIKFDELPEVDDEFAKDVSEFDTLDEYKSDIKAKLTERVAKAADAAMEESLANIICEKLEGDIPAPMVEVEAENMLRDYDTRLRMQGLDLNTYFKYTGQTLDSMREQFKPQAEKQVKTRLALEKIASLEDLKVEDKEVDEEFENIAKAYGMEVDKVKELVTAESVADDIRVRKAVEFVKVNAKIVAEAPAKKSPAKKSSSKKATAEKAEGEEKKPAAKKASSKNATVENSEDGEKKPAAKKTSSKKSAATKKTAEEADNTEE